MRYQKNWNMHFFITFNGLLNGCMQFLELFFTWQLASDNYDTTNIITTQERQLQNNKIWIDILTIYFDLMNKMISEIDCQMFRIFKL